MSDFRPSPVPYDPTPDAAPTTQAPNDYFSVRATPDDFGAQIGEGVQKASAGLADFAAKSQVLHDESVVNASMTSTWTGVNNTLYAPPKTDAKGNAVAGTGGFYSLRGSDAVNAYQSTVDTLNDQYQSARAALTPRQQVQYDGLMRRQFEGQLKGVGSHADQQGEVQQDQQTEALKATAANSAVLAATNGKFDDFDHFIDQGASAAAHWSLLKGLGNDSAAQEASTFVGSTVKNAADQFIALGDPNTAKIIFDHYQDQMDKGSVLAVETALKVHTRDVAASAAANSYPLPGETQPATGAAASGDQSGSSGNGAPPGSQTAGPGASAPAGSSPVIDTINRVSQEHGLDPALLTNIARIESGFNPSAHNPSGAAGLFQFMPGTAKQYGLANPLDPVASTEAAARLVIANRDYLTKELGRAPTNGELYLAHQQGAGGAAKLLSNPDALAVDIVGKAAVTGNGGTVNMTAGQFANLWTSKFGKGGGNQYSAAGPGPVQDQTPPQQGAPQIAPGSTLPGPQDQTPTQQGAPQTPQSDVNGAPTDIGASHQQKANILQDKASVLSDIQQRYADDPEMATAVTARYNQRLAASNLQQQADTQQALAAQDAGFNKYYTAAMKGAPASQLTQAIANDNTLSGTTKEHLVNALQTVGQGKALGSDFYSYFQRIHTNGPDKITSPDQLLAATDGESLTFEGANKLREELSGRKTVDGEAISDLKKAGLDNVKRGLVNEAEYGQYKKTDPKGMTIFTEQAVPAFDKAYRDGLAAGKSEFDLLTPGSKDFIGTQIIKAYQRSPEQIAKDTIGTMNGKLFSVSNVDTAISIANGGQAGSPPAAPAAAPATPDNVVHQILNPRGGAMGAPPSLSKFDLTTKEGIRAAFIAGSLQKDDAVKRLDAIWDTPPAATNAQVPNN